MEWVKFALSVLLFSLQLITADPWVPFVEILKLSSKTSDPTTNLPFQKYNCIINCYDVEDTHMERDFILPTNNTELTTSSKDSEPHHVQSSNNMNEHKSRKDQYLVQTVSSRNLELQELLLKNNLIDTNDNPLIVDYARMLGLHRNAGNLSPNMSYSTNENEGARQIMGSPFGLDLNLTAMKINGPVRIEARRKITTSLKIDNNPPYLIQNEVHDEITSPGKRQLNSYLKGANLSHDRQQGQFNLSPSQELSHASPFPTDRHKTPTDSDLDHKGSMLHFTFVEAPEGFIQSNSESTGNIPLKPLPRSIFRDAKMNNSTLSPNQLPISSIADEDNEEFVPDDSLLSNIVTEPSFPENTTPIPVFSKSKTSHPPFPKNSVHPFPKQTSFVGRKQFVVKASYGVRDPNEVTVGQSLEGSSVNDGPLTGASDDFASTNYSNGSFNDANLWFKLYQSAADNFDPYTATLNQNVPFQHQYSNSPIGFFGHQGISDTTFLGEDTFGINPFDNPLLDKTSQQLDNYETASSGNSVNSKRKYLKSSIWRQHTPLTSGNRMAVLPGRNTEIGFENRRSRIKIPNIFSAREMENSTKEFNLKSALQPQQNKTIKKNQQKNNKTSITKVSTHIEAPLGEDGQDNNEFEIMREKKVSTRAHPTSRDRLSSSERHQLQTRSNFDRIKNKISNSRLLSNPRRKVQKEVTSLDQKEPLTTFDPLSQLPKYLLARSLSKKVEGSRNTPSHLIKDYQAGRLANNIVSYVEGGSPLKGRQGNGDSNSKGKEVKSKAKKSSDEEEVIAGDNVNIPVRVKSVKKKKKKSKKKKKKKMEDEDSGEKSKKVGSHKKNTEEVVPEVASRPLPYKRLTFPIGVLSRHHFFEVPSFSIIPSPLWFSNELQHFRSFEASPKFPQPNSFFDNSSPYFRAPSFKYLNQQYQDFLKDHYKSPFVNYNNYNAHADGYEH